MQRAGGTPQRQRAHLFTRQPVPLHWSPNPTVLYPLPYPPRPRLRVSSSAMHAPPNGQYPSRPCFSQQPLQTFRQSFFQQFDPTTLYQLTPGPPPSKRRRHIRRASHFLTVYPQPRIGRLGRRGAALNLEWLGPNTGGGTTTALGNASPREPPTTHSSISGHQPWPTLNAAPVASRLAALAPGAAGAGCRASGAPPIRV